MDTIPSPPKPPSIAIIGWSTIAASILMIVTDLVGLLSFSMLDNLGSPNAPLLSQYLPPSMKKVMELYSYSRWMTWYEICFFLFALVGGVQFLRLRAWGRSALEAVCWLGLLNACLDTLLSYLIWENMRDSLSMVLGAVGGGQYSYMNPVGFFTIALGFFLWVIPSLGMIIYLRRPVIRQAVNLT